MQPSPPEAFGLKRFLIRVNWPIIGIPAWEILARDQKQAWAKFVELRFRDSSIKPDRMNYTITLKGE